jgi:Tol biopolymer transport system component
MTPDGRYIAFGSLASNLVINDTNGQEDVLVHDMLTGQTTRISQSSTGEQGNDYSYIPAITPDGRYIAFNSAASNLVAGDSNNKTDIFLHDRHTGTTVRVSTSSNGTEADNHSGVTSISSDGHLVAFDSSATTLVDNDANGGDDIFVRELTIAEMNYLYLPLVIRSP